MYHRLRVRFPKGMETAITVVFPLLAGVALYKYLPTHYTPGRLVRNYLPDGLWAYSLLSCILIIWNRKPHWVWILGAVISALLFEYGQYSGVLPGTGDWLDVATYLIFFGFALWTNAYFENRNIHKPQIKP